MYKCFIIDDESHAIETLKKYAKDSGQLEIIGTSQNPLEAVKFINEHKEIDITFLDIDMPEMSGLDVADLIYQNTAIIFTTGHAGYAVEGFEKNISDFMLKPISFSRFMKSLTKVITQLEKKMQEEVKNDTYFFVNPGIKGKMLKINFNDVEFIEGLNNYIVIHTPPNNHIVYLTMKEMEAGLPPEIFIRVHKSYIVNINKVTLMEGNKIMINKMVFPIGSSYKDKLLKKINNNIIKTHR
ncbi:LytTR family DNA-binding domain-containing protein [Pedobacter sp. MC2016-15]|jgi:DNA-binding LytR/AlgR family response regulator|uniref:LytR/AlgR family response regulator transcription factor n=1 Tax=Pedobacter sp. MC2016-15 TaxID=2994473 RepID=UPI002245980D|nr:LytTR family DNA-binding domain-containing protein [Pedobacter sp. MC2016-15]MCX2477890.1 LytTR family DNA-binding domain-containing protein [Pedobacter sp. MC2016-15]